MEGKIENLEEVMVQVDEELVDIKEMEVHGMDQREINIRRKNLFGHRIIVIQVVKDGS